MTDPSHGTEATAELEAQAPGAPAAVTSEVPAAPEPEGVRAKPGKHARGGAGEGVGAARSSRTRTSGRGWLPFLLVLVVLLATGVGLLARLSVTTRGTDPLELQRRDALAVARASSRVIFSYDYRHLDKDFAAGRAFTTGAFRTEYDTTTTKLVTDVAKRYQGVAVADVSAAAVESASKNRVVALVFLNQQSSSTIQTTPKISQSRLEMTLVRTGGHWLVSGVKAL